MKLLIVFVVAVAAVAVQAGNVALNKQVYGNGNNLEVVTDGDGLTCMNSGERKNPTIKIDLGKPVSISKIHLTLGPNAKRKFHNTLIRAGNNLEFSKNPVCARLDNKKAPIENELDCEATARYVSVTKVGKGRWLILCEVQIMSAAPPPPTIGATNNIALHKHVQGPGGTDPMIVTDGDKNTCRTTGTRKSPYVIIDLGRHYDVETVRLTLHPGASRTFHNTVIRAGDSQSAKSNPVCATINNRNAPVDIERSCVRNARYIVVQKMGVARGMVLCEVEVFAKDEGPEILPTEPLPPPIETTDSPTVAPETKTDAPDDKTTIPTTLGCEFPSGMTNLALGKSVSQSSVKVGGVPERAVDGNKNSHHTQGKSCTQTAREFEPHWMVDLGKISKVHKLEITNRMDCCFFRIKNAEVRVGNNPDFRENPVCGNWVLGKRARQETITVTCGCDVPMKGRYVSIQLRDKTQVMHLCEVDVLGF
ncbi:uncharacterized protein LOC144453187 [Glandiceps talaboti]